MSKLPDELPSGGSTEYIVMWIMVLLMLGCLVIGATAFAVLIGGGTL